MANADSNVLPAPAVSYQKEETNRDDIVHHKHEEETTRFSLPSLPVDKNVATAHKDEWDKDFEEQNSSHQERIKETKESICTANLETADACHVASTKEGHKIEYKLQSIYENLVPI